jgi:hypothetical protein
MTPGSGRLAADNQKNGRRADIFVAEGACREQGNFSTNQCSCRPLEFEHVKEIMVVVNPAKQFTR